MRSQSMHPVQTDWFSLWEHSGALRTYQLLKPLYMCDTGPSYFFMSNFQLPHFGHAFVSVRSQFFLLVFSEISLGEWLLPVITQKQSVIASPKNKNIIPKCLGATTTVTIQSVQVVSLYLHPRLFTSSTTVVSSHTPTMSNFSRLQIRYG